MVFNIGDIGKNFKVTIKTAKGEATQNYWGKDDKIDTVVMMFFGVNAKNKTHHFIFKTSNGLWSPKYSISQDKKTLYRCGYCKAGAVLKIERLKN